MWLPIVVGILVIACIWWARNEQAVKRHACRQEMQTQDDFVLPEMLSIHE